MHDLATRIRDHYESAADPVTVDEIFAAARRETTLQQAHMRPTPAPAGSRRRRLVAVAVATAVLVFVGGTALIFQRTGTDSPVAPVATSPLIDSFSSLSWSRVPHDEAVFGGGGGQSMYGVTVGGPGLVAVGRNTPDAAVWTSVDGITWTRVPHDEIVFGGATMWDVTFGGPGLVAVGWHGQEFLDPDVDAAIWTSADGVTWSRVRHDEEVFGGAWINSVTVGGPGLVAVGGSDGWFTDGDAAVWTSVDGITWSRVPHDESVFGGEDSQVMHDVTVGGPGVVAVGRDGGIGPWDNNPETNAAVWTSVDGITWSRVPHDEAVFGTGGNPSMLGVTVGGPGLVAVGADLGPPALAETPVWTSVDGITWTRVPDDETVHGIMTGVTARGSGLVAVGEAGRVWTSVDGITWSRVPENDAFFGRDWIFRVTVGGPGLVGVGREGGFESSDAAVWVAVPGE